MDNITPFDIDRIPNDIEISSSSLMNPQPPLQEQTILPYIIMGGDRNDQYPPLNLSESFKRRSSVHILDNDTARRISYKSMKSNMNKYNEQDPIALKLNEDDIDIDNDNDNDSNIENATDYDNENEEELFQAVSQTITKTWLILYGTVIRILDFLVGVSLSYEKHSLSLLRALSVISLVLTCMSFIY